MYNADYTVLLISLFKWFYAINYNSFILISWSILIPRHQPQPPSQESKSQWARNYCDYVHHLHQNTTIGIRSHVVWRSCVWIIPVSTSATWAFDTILHQCGKMFDNIYNGFLPNVFFISSSSNMTYHVPPWQHWCLAVRPVLWPSGTSWGNEGRK